MSLTSLKFGPWSSLSTKSTTIMFFLVPKTRPVNRPRNVSYLFLNKSQTLKIDNFSIIKRSIVSPVHSSKNNCNQLSWLANDSFKHQTNLSQKSLPSIHSQIKDNFFVLKLSKSEENNDTTNNDKDPTKASEEQLALLTQRLTSHLPYFFQKPHDFRLYNRNIIFEDNIRNVRTAGLNAYAWQIARIKMGAHLKYGKVSFSILKITTHPEESTIKIRWRIVTYPGNMIVFAFWRFKLWNIKESLDRHKDEWIDGFSIMHVGGDGLIYKHICDKVMVDPNEVKSGFKKNSLAVKLGMAT